MFADPKECREQAKRCLKLAAETTDPVLRSSLIDAAQRWERLAADLDPDHASCEATDQLHKKAGWIPRGMSSPVEYLFAVSFAVADQAARKKRWRPAGRAAWPDAPMVAKLAKIGLVPGENFDITKLDPAVAKGLEEAPKAAQESIVAHFKKAARTSTGGFS